MTFMARITPELTDGERVTVRLLRRYVFCREAELRPLPSLINLGAQLGVCSFAVVALASLFQLTESCLRRTLVAERCCTEKLGTDERAILLLMETEGVGLFPGGSTIPDGLLAALNASRLTVRLTLRT